MRTGAIPETLLESVALASGLVPTPAIDTLAAALLVESLVVAVKVGVFDALEAGALATREVARRCNTHERATEKLLAALVGAGYLEGRAGCFALAPVARRWLLRSRRPSLVDHVALMPVVLRWLSHYETYVRTGEALDVHDDIRPEEWGPYQRGMRSLASLVAPELALRTRIPRGAERMLDVGGAHGLFSVALCRKHPRLRATILDLPDAVRASAPLLAEEGLGDRVVHAVGDALTHDYGRAAFDVVLLANIVHHFDDAQNRALMSRIATALRPGGVVIVQEVEQDESGLGALGGLYFAALSASGTWTFDEIADWQRSAGLTPRRPMRLFSAPGVGQQAATRPR